MIDVENEIFTILADLIRKEVEDVIVSGEYVHAPSKFPAVTISEVDNYPTPGKMINTGETFVTLMYEVNVYSNRTSGKKSEAKDILDIIDAEFQRMGFRRTVKTPVPNLENSSIYRLVARYTAETDGTTIYRR